MGEKKIRLDKTAFKAMTGGGSRCYMRNYKKFITGKKD